jgi:flagellin-like hook-associated protein FlgL
MHSSAKTKLASSNAQNNLSPSQGVRHTFLQRLRSGIRLTGSKADDINVINASCTESHAVGVRHSTAPPRVVIRTEGAPQNNMARMLELAIQGANATSEEEIAAVDAEFTRLLVKHFSSSS